MLDEESKAVQKMAETTGKAIDAGEKIGGFINKIFGPGFEQLGLTFLDWATFIRQKNFLKIYDLVNEIHKKRGVEGKTNPILPRLGIPMINEATLEDREEIQKLWAGLIANATDPNKRFNIQKTHIDILSKLEPLAAELLEWFGNQKNPSINITQREIIESFGVPDVGIETLLENLINLGCIHGSSINTLDDVGPIYSKVGYPNTIFYLTATGESLLEACAD